MVFLLLTWLVKRIWGGNHLQLLDPHFLHSGWFLRHSLASPLSSILINLEQAQQNPLTTSQLHACVQQAWLSAQRVNSLLTPPTSPASAAFSVLPLLTETLNCHPLQYHQYLHTFIYLSPKVKLKGNYFYFQEALACILTNALTAVAEAPPTKASTQPVVLVMGYQKDNSVELKIIDNGVGMNWWTRWCATQLGYSHRQTTGGGTGLGLAFVKSVVEKHFGGRLVIQSRPTFGTTITCRFPVSDP